MPLDPTAPVEIAVADPAWPDRFNELRAVYESALSALSVTVEHVGSTAVPGLDAKPILDIAILCADSATRDTARERLECLGYESEGDRGVPGRESLRRKGPDVPAGAFGGLMDHHLYLALSGSEYAEVQRRFRDYLKRNPPAARHYATLKRSLARAFGHDREEYTERKGPFVRAVLAAEAAERGAGIHPGERSNQAGLDAGPEIDYPHFSSVDMRVGTVIDAQPLPRARRPAVVLDVDAGPLGLLTSSAQITDRYAPADLLGRQVVAVVNLPPKQIGSVMSRCLVLGAMTPDAVVLLAPDAAVANGTRVR